MHCICRNFCRASAIWRYAPWGVSAVIDAVPSALNSVSVVCAHVGSYVVSFRGGHTQSQGTGWSHWHATEPTVGPYQSGSALGNLST
jgi:hypothetical protein